MPSQTVAQCALPRFLLASLLCRRSSRTCRWTSTSCLTSCSVLRTAMLCLQHQVSTSCHLILEVTAAMQQCNSEATAVSEAASSFAVRAPSADISKQSNHRGCARPSCVHCFCCASHSLQSCCIVKVNPSLSHTCLVAWSDSPLHALSSLCCLVCDDRQ